MKKFLPHTRVLPWFMALLLSTLVAACGGGGGGKDPILGADVAAIAPTVIATSPLNRTPNVTGVSINAKVTATFSRDMTASTITTSNFKVACPVGTPAPGTVSVAYVASSRIATFSHTTNFPINTVCTVTITTGVKSSKDVNMAQDYVWKFQTGSTADSTAPTITTTGATDGETGLPINRNSTVTFSEPMDPDSLTNSFTVKEFVSGAAVAGVVTYSGNTATFNPNSNLSPNTKYTSTVSTAATDLAGNALVSGARANPWSWTTGSSGDTTAPTVTLVNPLDLATGVCINKSVNATFSEAMNQTTINDTTFTLQVSGPPLGSLVTGVYTYDVVSNVSTFNPTSDLLPNTKYTATVTTGVKDLAGNGLASNKVWTFTTGTTTCAAAPALGRATPFGNLGGTAGTTNTGNLTRIFGGDLASTATTTGSITGFADSNTPVPDVYTPGGADVNKGIVSGRIYTCTVSTTGPTSAAVNAASCTIATDARLDADNVWSNVLSPAALPGGTDPGAGELGGLTLAPGIYKSAGATFQITGSDLTLDGQGDANAVWVFQTAAGLTVGAPAAPRIVNLVRGAQAKNVFWRVGTSARIEDRSTMVGTIIARDSVTISTAGQAQTTTLNGRATGLDASVTMVNTIINVPAP